MQQHPSPLFIVGMPRSGTKLLRNLLDNHSMMAFPPAETHFLPHFYHHFSRYGDISQPNNFDRFYQDLKRFSFFGYIPEADRIWSQNEFFNALTTFTFQDVFDTFLKIYSRHCGKIIYGDKTPEYLVQTPLLKKVFPQSIFIHIIRDVRDYCLSIKNAWNKNIYRAAHRWRTSVGQCRADGNHLGPESYLEIRYETLLDEPQKTLEKICRFIGVPFEPGMLELKAPTENLGSAKGQKALVPKNYNKWKNAFSKKEIGKIESIAGALMLDLGYAEIENPGSKNIGKISMNYYKALDTCYLVLFRMKKMGSFRHALKWSYYSAKTRLR